MGNIMYIVFAYRMGQRDGYHFPVGVFETEEAAREAAKIHYNYRGGKYDHVIWEAQPNRDYDAEECPKIYDNLDQ